MNGIIDFATYVLRYWPDLLQLVVEHLLMVALGLLVALLIGIPLGALCARNDRVASVILAMANMVQVFPSLALLAVLMLIFGLGFTTVVVGLVLYSLLPIIRNTYVGLREVDDAVIRAGRGMGMTRLQLLLKVEFPLSLPFVLAGTRIAVLIAVGVATLAPFVGGGGLGAEIYGGISSYNEVRIFAGAILASLMAVLADYAIGRMQKRLERSTA